MTTVVSYFTFWTFRGKKVSIATVISNTDTIDGDDDYSSDNSVTEI